MTAALNVIEIAMVQMTVVHYAKCMKMVLTEEQHQQYRQLAMKLNLIEANLTLHSAAQHLGSQGGKAKSKAKTKAVRENGKLGGRPASDLFCWHCAPESGSVLNDRLIDISDSRYYKYKSCSVCGEKAHYRLSK